jgi:hypothetical protein
MATRANTSAQSGDMSSAVASVPSLAGGLSGPSLGSRPLVLRPGRGPFTWMVSPAKLGCHHGKIVPLMATAWHAPGLSGNRRGDLGRGYQSQLEMEGYVAIPHNWGADSLAVGVPRTGAADSTYLQRWNGVTIYGAPAVQWTHAWKQPQQLGHRVDWVSDDAGRIAFMQRALIELANEGRELSDLQIRIAVEPLQRRIVSESIHDSGHARMVVRQCAVHLPREHHTHEITAILNRMDIVLPDPE